MVDTLSPLRREYAPGMDGPWALHRHAIAPSVVDHLLERAEELYARGAPGHVLAADSFPVGALDVDIPEVLGSLVDVLDMAECRAINARLPDKLTCGVAALAMVMPRSRSSSMESILAPTPSLPRTSWMAWIRSV